jgi:hypothetical protein
MWRLGIALSVIILIGATGATGEMKCGSQSCGTPTKSQKTIEGVVHNCDVKKCTTSCCSLADPPVCQIKTETISDCTPARLLPGGKLRSPTVPELKTLQQ